jgi:hypothetical protein
MTTDLQFCTVGWLIGRLQRHEHIKPWLMKTYNNTLVKFGDEAAAKLRARYADDLLEPDPALMPGIDRIEVLCDELGDGAGLTVANVRKVRAKVCRALGCTLASVDTRSLDDAANAIDADELQRSQERPPAVTNGKKKKKPGPKKARHNIVNDKKIFDQWNNGHARGDFPTYQECDKTHQHPPGTTKAAVARHRGRERNAK